MYANSLSCYSLDIDGEKLQILINYKSTSSEKINIYRDFAIKGGAETIVSVLKEHCQSLVEEIDDCELASAVDYLNRLEIYLHFTGEVCDDEVLRKKLYLALYSNKGFNNKEIMDIIRASSNTGFEIKANELDVIDDVKSDELHQLICNVKNYWEEILKPVMACMSEDIGEAYWVDTFMLGGGVHKLCNAYGNATRYMNFDAAVKELEKTLIGDLDETFNTVKSIFGTDQPSQKEMKDYKPLFVNAIVEAKDKDPDVDMFDDVVLEDDDYNTYTAPSENLINLMNEVHDEYYGSFLYDFELQSQLDLMNN